MLSANQKSPDLEKIFQIDKRERTPISVRPQGAEILPVDGDVAPEPARGQAAHPHDMCADRQVARPDAMRDEEAQHQLEVRTDWIVERIEPVFLEARTAHERARMRWERRETEHPATEEAACAIAPRRLTADLVLRPPADDEPDIGIRGIDLGTKRLRDFRQRVVLG